MRFGVRELVYIGLFGAIWAALEITLGSYLHVLKVPFTGTVMTALGIAIALVGRSSVPKRGSVLFIGVVTALLKMFSLGGIVLNPMIGILAESALAEIGLLASGRPRWWTFTLAGALAVSWDFFHRFFTQALLAGRGVLEIYRWTIEEGSRLLGIGETAAIVLIALLIAIRLVLGGIAGFSAWSLAAAVRRRTGEEIEVAWAEASSK